jgi:DNA-binding NarL/FixJ family response regulator
MNTLLHTKSQNTESQKRSTASLRLLFAEDEQDLAEEFASQLRECYNYDVDIAKSEEQAIEKFKQSLQRIYPYDFVITDLQMETFRSGLEVVKEVKAKHPNTEVIILTVHDVSEYREEALKIGALAYILKFSDDLVDLVHQTIQKAIAAKQKNKVYDNFDSEIDIEEDIVVRMQPISQYQVTIQGKHLGSAQLQVIYDENLD